jgi:16S rRNA processing protein RimM
VKLLTEKYYNVGKIVNTQGIKGEVRVISMTDFKNERFKPGNVLYLFMESVSDPLPLTIRTHRSHKQFELLSFEGYSSINEVEKFKGSMLKVKEEDRKSLPEGEYYFDQIIGLSVYTEDGEQIGVIKEILQPGANDVWVVKREKKPDLLLPYIDACIKQVDLSGKKVIVHLLEGLE